MKVLDKCIGKISLVCTILIVSMTILFGSATSTRAQTFTCPFPDLTGSFRIGASNVAERVASQGCAGQSRSTSGFATCTSMLGSVPGNSGFWGVCWPRFGPSVSFLFRAGDYSAITINGVSYAAGALITLPCVVGNSCSFSVRYTNLLGQARETTITKNIGATQLNSFTVSPASTSSGDDGSKLRSSVANFITRRADQITANDPDIVSRLERRGTSNGTTL